MEIIVKIFGELYRYLPGGLDHATITLPPGSNLADLLQKLQIPDHAIWVITVNDRRVPEEQPLATGDVVAIFAPVAGG